MAKTKISEFSTTPGNNTDINGINISEGCAPSGINNAIRELMSDLKEWQSGAMDVYVIPQGTAASPGIQLYSDTNTGIYAYGTDQLGVAAGGFSAGYFSASGWNGNVNGSITGDITADNILVTNIKAKDNTAAITITDSTGAVTLANAVTMSATTQNIALGTSQTTGTYTVGGTAQTGTQSIGRSTKTHTFNVATGATESGATKTVNIATAGVSGSTTTISIGSSVSGATSNTTLSGNVTATRDMTVNGITVGKGKGSEGSNTAIGLSALAAFTTGESSTAIGHYALWKATTSAFNTAVGAQSQLNSLTGGYNTSVGALTLNTATAGFFNVAIGFSALNLATGDNNTAVGNGAGSLITTGAKNTIIGNYTGNQGGLDITTSSNYIVLSDGDGNPRAYWNGADATFSGVLDVATIETTNIKAKDGTASITLADSTGVATFSKPTVMSVDSASDALRITQIGAGNALVVEDSANPDTSPFIVKADGSVGMGLTSPVRNIHISSSTAPGGGLTGIQVDATGTGASATSAYVFNRTTTNASAAQTVGAIYFSHTLTDATPLTTAALISVVANNNAGANTGDLYLNPRTSTIFQVNGSSIATINANGIDTTNLEVTNIKAKDGTAALSIADSTGAVTVSSAFAANGGATLGDASGDALTINSSAVSTPNGLNFDSDTFVIDATNNRVGIGTNSPGERLVVSNAAGSVAAQILASTTGTSNLYFADGTTGADNYTGFIQYNHSTNAMSFGTNGGNTRLTLDSSGNLLVGSTSTSGLITGQLQLGTTSSSNAGIQFLNSTTGSGGLYFGDSTSGNARFRGSIEYSHTSDAMLFSTSEIERMRLDSSGNLGLGVTPSAWLTWKAMQVGSRAAFVGNSTASFVANNFYYDGADGRYIASATAALYEQSAGTHKFFTAASGTAGNIISFTQAMTLDASGRLGIGQTSLTEALTVKTQNASTFINIQTSSDSGVYVGNNGGAMILSAGNTEKARITSGGYFKASNNAAYVGSTDPYHELNTNAADWTAFVRNTNATTPYGLRVFFSGATPNGTGSQFFYCSDSTALRAEIRSNGGIANYSANNVALSDQRVKKDIVAAPSYWDKIKGIEIVLFKYKDQTHDDNNVGVIAQQVEQVAPEFVDQDGWDETPEDGVPLKSIYTSDMYHAAIKALQEAMARIEQLEAKVAVLEGK